MNSTKAGLFHPPVHLEKEMPIYSSILAWEINGQRSLAVYSPWDFEESDTTERLNNSSGKLTGEAGFA